MRKIIVFTFLLASLCFSTAYGQGFIVEEIAEDLSMVVLRDQVSGQEWVAEKGDVIEGWTVEDIAQSHVTISKLSDNNIVLRAHIPAQQMIHSTQQGQ